MSPLSVVLLTGVRNSCAWLGSFIKKGYPAKSFRIIADHQTNRRDIPLILRVLSVILWQKTSDGMTNHPGQSFFLEKSSESPYD
jgi:hypothetical protein